MTEPKKTIVQRLRDPNLDTSTLSVDEMVLWAILRRDDIRVENALDWERIYGDPE